MSVIISLWIIKRKELPFDFCKEDLKICKKYLRKMIGFGAPIALQDLLVSISFLIILAIVNGMGVVASAGVGVAEKVCAFIMLISSAFMQSIVCLRRFSFAISAFTTASARRDSSCFKEFWGLSWSGCRFLT